MELSHPPNNTSRRRHWEWLLLLLALLMSFACIFLSTWLSLNAWPDRLVKASMLAGDGADYKRSDQEDVAFGSLNPEVGAEAATDAARLQLTPLGAGSSTPAGIALLPPTPRPSATPTLAVVTRVPSPAPASPTPTHAPTLPPSPTPTSVPPTATTRPAPTQVPIPTETATSTPPPPPDTPTPVPPPPTDTPTRTPEPTHTPRPHPPTHTPVPPTDTPTPTDTPVSAPTVLAILPQAALRGSSVPVTIAGNNFESGLQAVLDLGGTPTPLLNVTWTSATTLTADVPSTLPVGMYTLTVTNPGPTNLTGSLANAFQVFTYTLASTVECSSDIDSADCDNAKGDPNDNWTPVFTPTDVITFDFGSPGIMDGPGYDLVFYERAYPDQNPRGIQLDYVKIEIFHGGTWLTLFSWDGILGDVVGTNIDSYATDADGEDYNEAIPMYDLYPGIPGGPNTGIAIDVSRFGNGPFRYIRVTRPPGGPAEPAEVDAIVQLN